MKNNKKYSLLFLIENHYQKNRMQLFEQLRQVLNVSVSTIQRYMYAEIGAQTTMAAEHLFKLATFFNVKPTDLFTDEYKKHLNFIVFEID